MTNLEKAKLVATYRRICSLNWPPSKVRESRIDANVHMLITIHRSKTKIAYDVAKRRGILDKVEHDGSKAMMSEVAKMLGWGQWGEEPPRCDDQLNVIGSTYEITI